MCVKCPFRNGLSSILAFLVHFVCLLGQIPRHFRFVVYREPVWRRSTIRGTNSVRPTVDEVSKKYKFFDVLLTVHLSIFISVFNQLDAQNLFHSKFISCLYMFRALCAHHQEVKIMLYSLWYHHTYRCDDTRGCIMQFWPPDDEHMCSKHVKAWNKTYLKQILCIKLVKYCDKKIYWLVREIHTS